MMAMVLKYKGEFLSRAGIVWRAEIFVESESSGVVRELTFEADEAIKISYPETAKENVLCGSTATLQIESPGDRTYIDLYTVRVGAVRLDLYRNDRLYWSGTLDTEFYEEPYERAAHYTVTLTFSDFGVLDRLKYTLSGPKTIGDIIRHSLGKTGINYQSIDTSLVSTGLDNSAPMSLDDVSVYSDNFYDEDGEPSTLKEVIEGVLQPLGMRMTQRDGKVWIYDLNGLYTVGDRREAIWSADSSTLGVDVVYSDAKITWSPYARSGNLCPDRDCWTEDIDRELLNLNSYTHKQYGSAYYISYSSSDNPSWWPSADWAGFTLWISRKGENIELSDKFDAQFFKIVPQNDGTDTDGVAILWKGFTAQYSNSSDAPSGLLSMYYGIDMAQDLKAKAENSAKDWIFRTNPVSIPRVDRPSKLLLRIKLEALFDTRYDYSIPAINLHGTEHQKDWQTDWEQTANLIYIPVVIKFQPDGSDDVYAWTNIDCVSEDVNKANKILVKSKGRWERYTETNGKPSVYGYLCYYDNPDSMGEGTVVNKGWKPNKPAVSPRKGYFTKGLLNFGDGQPVIYPDMKCSGQLTVEVLAHGWMSVDWGEVFKNGWLKDDNNVWSGKKLSWILFKAPEIELIKSNQFEREISDEDIEYSAVLNADAKESIELDTICGTSTDETPTARGAYIETATGKQLHQFSRAGRTTQAEELLIGTIYSQYAERHATLSGEIELHPCGPVAYTEQNQGDRVFIMTGEDQDIITDTTEATLIELSPDEYDKDDEQDL